MKRTTTLLALLLTTGLATASAFAGPNGSKTSNEAGPHKQKLLQKYDTNKDGVLDANEKAAFKADRAKHKQARQANRAARIAKFDTNGNGTIEPAEKQAAIIQRSNTRFDKMLVKLDTNGDKMLSAAEFAAKAKAAKAGKAGKWAGKARNPGKAKARFARMDADNNGLITRAEFRKAALTRGAMHKGKRGHGKHQGRGQGKAKTAPTK